MQLSDDIINVFNFIGRLVCHQRPERTLWIGGHYLPVCARDTGVFFGLLLGYTLLPFLRRKEAKGPPNLYLSLAMTLPLWIDSFGQAFGFWTSTNDLRLITGLLFGVALAPLLIYSLSLSPLKGKTPLIKNIQPKTAVLDDKDSWFDAKALGFGVLLSVILFFAIRSLVGSEFSLFYWLLSVPIIVEIILHFFVLPPLLLIVALRKIMRQKGKTYCGEPVDCGSSFGLHTINQDGLYVVLNSAR
jgi:uncharacterized membrane protein/uncharacterized integral membrane protein